MAKIFVSYRRDDAGYVAGMLGERLRKAFGRDSVFIDLDTIPFGTDFRDHISTAVSECDVLLALIGDEWLTLCADDGRRRIDDPADFVSIEIEAAMNREIPVIPVLIHSAEMPRPEDLPDQLRSLAFRNGAELRAGRDLNHHVELLIRDLQKHLTPSLPQPAVGAAVAVVPTAAPGVGTLRFTRSTGRLGSVVSFKITIDGELAGKLSVGEHLDVSVSSGAHQIEVTGGGTFVGDRKDVTIAADQLLSWNVRYTLTGGVTLSEATPRPD